MKKIKLDFYSQILKIDRIREKAQRHQLSIPQNDLKNWKNVYLRWRRLFQKTHYTYVFGQLLCYEQNVTRGQFFAGLNPEI